MGETTSEASYYTPEQEEEVENEIVAHYEYSIYVLFSLHS